MFGSKEEGYWSISDDDFILHSPPLLLTITITL